MVSPSHPIFEGFPEFRPGTVWLVGAGPGAPGLLTLLALHGLQQADVVVHDALVSDAVLGFANPSAEHIHAGKRGGKPSAVQADITRTLIALAQSGKRVLRLKGGDPFVFGRGAEEALGLAAHNIDFRIVPGISAGIGGLAYAGIPVTHRDFNQSVTFLTGHDLSGDLPLAIDWAGLAKAAPVIVMYMAVKHLPDIAARLLAAGRAPDEAVAVVMEATLPTQRVISGTLGDVAALMPQIAPPALIVLGPASSLRPVLDWYDTAARENRYG
ncbi:uroporphyrin-III C-methyltransferase [Devosia enhydra]|uniref:uroporphyrinogen-III C-methyltransferase n=1 Tax=Devosia enhydra TaxID=665118 RepID=A0A1K2HXF9_9HYPH|nr:uroporphyrinogen-III C-methyltransferase [Devosia enhydra]SFZ84300.1 uroporphyrin-III C-methyltransferase [Devosia enhydra]